MKENYCFVLVTPMMGEKYPGDGGPFVSEHEHFFLISDVVDFAEFKAQERFEDLSFLTGLYVKKKYSLRRISKELGCSRWLVRKKLKDAGIEIYQYNSGVEKSLVKRIDELRDKGNSYGEIAKKFNLWKIRTRRGLGEWHAMSVRQVHRNRWKPTR